MMGVQSRCSMGQIVMGGGHSHLEECSWSTCPSQEDFCPHRVWYWGVVARKSERVYAWGWKGRKEVCRGERWLSPWGTCKITVVVDGGWSKRPHIVKHSYIAKSGVAVIIGQQTGKLRHIGVPHRYSQHVHKKFPETKISVTKSGMHLLLGWRWTLSWRASGRQSKCMVSDICGSLEMVIVPCIQPFWGSVIKKIECAKSSMQVLSILTGNIR